MTSGPLLQFVVIAMALAVAPGVHAQTDAGLPAFLRQQLEAARAQAAIPGLAAVIQVRGKLVAEAAVGLRAEGQPEPVTTLDRWHIGSDTKAFTTTLLGRLVDRGRLRFEETMASALPRLAGELHPAYRAVTLLQLVSSTAGLPGLTDDAELPEFLAVLASAQGVVAQRAAVARHYLARPPASPIGRFRYSNLGFIIAGAIAEARTGQSWETLLSEEIFVPLGITGAGFGAPGTPGRNDQPRGHDERAGRQVALAPDQPEADNPKALGPAGTLHLPLRDWLRFAQDHLDGVRGRGRLLRPATYRRLHTPVRDNYALGWGTKLSPDGQIELLTHSGSNGHWLADLRIFVPSATILITVMNTATERASDAQRTLTLALRDRLLPAPSPAPPPTPPTPKAAPLPPT